jgi:hypothetical protein
MKSKKESPHSCDCNKCGNGCSVPRGVKKEPLKKPGFLAARPWIWIVLGYLFMVGALSTMVVISVKHQQADVLVTHGR